MQGMKWNRKYVITSYIKGSLWLVPLLAMAAYGVFSQVTLHLGVWLQHTGRLDQAHSYYGLSVAGARTLLETSITANLSFLVFTFGSLLVAIQVASGQYTPRIIATTLLRDNAIRFTVGYFVFSMMYAAKLLIWMGDGGVLQLNTFIAGVLGLGSCVIFLYLIDYAARFLRPVSILGRVGETGIQVIEALYPLPTSETDRTKPPSEPRTWDRIVAHTGRSASVLAVDLEGLVALAERCQARLEFVPQVGDFVAVGEPLFRVQGGRDLPDEALRAAVALGSERTMEQDPTFAFRILVDIAIKALSPAINDPTTAVLALDHLHRLLRQVGLRHVSHEHYRDAAGAVRLVFRTPNWEDFVHLACTEIRQCGANSVQIMRRMRSLLMNLQRTLPEHRQAELRQQLDFLDREVERNYAFPEDQALARLPDPQGLGGAVGMEPLA